MGAESPARQHRKDLLLVLQAAGGSEIGIGHLSRCRSLAIEFLRQGTATVVLLFEAPDELAQRFAPPGTQLIIADSRKSALGIRKKVLAESHCSRSALLTDLLHLGAEDAALAREQGFQFLVHVNDSGLPAYAADLIFDGDAFQSMPAYSPKTARCFRGPGYHIVNGEVVAQRPSQPWHASEVANVLVCFGGADPGQQTEFFVRELQKRSSTVTFTVVAGPAFSPHRRQALPSLLGPGQKLVHAPEHIAQLLLEHDVVVTLGGLTSYEAMCLGRPVLAVSWANMAPYVQKLAEIGLLKNLGAQHNCIQHFFEALADLPSLHRLARAGWQTIDGQGAQRVVTTILDRCQP